MEQQPRSGWAIAGQVLAIVIAVPAALFSGWMAVLLLGSITGPTSADPHGYTLVFGSMFLIPASFVGAVALPWTVPRSVPRGRRAAVIGATVWVLGALGLAGIALGGG